MFARSSFTDRPSVLNSSSIDSLAVAESSPSAILVSTRSSASTGLLPPTYAFCSEFIGGFAQPYTVKGSAKLLQNSRRLLCESSGTNSSALAERLGDGQRQVSKIEHGGLESAKVGTIRSASRLSSASSPSGTSWETSGCRSPDPNFACPPPRSEGSRKTSAKLALARAPPVRWRQIALALLGTRGISHALILPVWSDTGSTAEYDARVPTAGDPVPSLRRGILPDLPVDRSASEGDRVALEPVNRARVSKSEPPCSTA